ncbi:hypothetical protein L3X37_13210 [Sabulilitoribacter arenilitoris]|uniref:Uncharacterized protein n=1 Tax=Wocania arenilitoris TaxID=2044858 RepID=A0AAE3ES96_9FLAO|nr:hypothetical protein [Wocania arenilitoris]MCF7569309.1 hypothetical protein [Wocania arenilitoris]
MTYFNYILIILGAIVALYSKAGEQQNQYILIGGLVVLMIGVYRVSRTIPSRKVDDNNTPNKLNNDEQ